MRRLMTGFAVAVVLAFVVLPNVIIECAWWWVCWPF